MKATKFLKRNWTWIRQNAFSMLVRFHISYKKTFMRSISTNFSVKGIVHIQYSRADRCHEPSKWGCLLRREVIWIVQLPTVTSFKHKITKSVLTALLVLMSILPFKKSKTFSRFPARAARRKLELPSVWKKTILIFLFIFILFLFLFFF